MRKREKEGKEEGEEENIDRRIYRVNRKNKYNFFIY